MSLKKIRLSCILISLGSLFLSSQITLAQSSSKNPSMPTLHILCSTALKSTMEALVPSLEQEGHMNIQISFNSTNLLLDSFKNGSAADVIIVTKEAIDDLIKQNTLLVPRVDIASTSVGLAMKTGTPTIVLKDAQALKEFLIQSESIAYTTTGVSGQYIGQMIDKLGLKQTLASKTKLIPGGLAAELIVSGQAQVALQNLSELRAVPGTVVIATLPPELQLVTTFSSGTFASSKQTALAQKFSQMMQGDHAKKVLITKGLDPQ
jgi:molybdate transport system substrate-binding protein